MSKETNVPLTSHTYWKTVNNSDNEVCILLTYMLFYTYSCWVT